LALRGAEPDGQVESEDRIGVVGLSVKVEGLGVIAQSIAGSERGQRGVARLARIADGLGQVDGLGRVAPVAGQFTYPCAGTIPAEVFEGFGHLTVHPGPASRAELLIEGVLDERVGEAVTPRSVG